MQIEIDRMEKYLLRKWISKESQCSNTYIEQTRLLNKDCNKRKRRTLYNNKDDNPKGRYNNYKYFTPKIRIPKYIKHLITNIQELINNKTIIVRDFNNPLTSMDRSSKQKINK